jgi:hypothetical protein
MAEAMTRKAKRGPGDRACAERTGEIVFSMRTCLYGALSGHRLHFAVVRGPESGIILRGSGVRRFATMVFFFG